MKKFTIEDAKNLAIIRNGICLSEKCESNYIKILWQCSRKHQWFSTVRNINIGRWCPQCNTSYSENYCRAYFEAIFNNKFPTSYPKWLIGKSGRQLELDGYCEELGIAFEHNGYQHYRVGGKFNVSDDALQTIKNNDQTKQQLCEKHGVKLIIVPELGLKIKHKDLLNYIADQCKQHDIVFDFSTDIIIDEETIYQPNNYHKKYNLSFWETLIKSKNGTLLSKEFKSINHKLEIKCNICNIVWKSKASHLRSGSWCPKCSLNIGDIEKMNCLALQYKGKCLSTTYVNNNTKLIWKCEADHVFEKLPRAVVSGGWCNKCNELKPKDKRPSKETKYNLNYMTELAKKRNGICLSTEYRSTAYKMKWHCNIHSYEWEARVSHILDGSWCQQCNYDKRSNGYKNKLI